VLPAFPLCAPVLTRRQAKQGTPAKRPRRDSDDDAPPVDYVDTSDTAEEDEEDDADERQQPRPARAPVSLPTGRSTHARSPLGAATPHARAEAPPSPWTAKIRFTLPALPEVTPETLDVSVRRPPCRRPRDLGGVGGQLLEPLPADDKAVQRAKRTCKDLHTRLMAKKGDHDSAADASRSQQERIRQRQRDVDEKAAEQKRLRQQLDECQADVARLTTQVWALGGPVRGPHLTTGKRADGATRQAAEGRHRQGCSRGIPVPPPRGPVPTGAGHAGRGAPRGRGGGGHRGGGQGPPPVAAARVDSTPTRVVFANPPPAARLTDASPWLGSYVALLLLCVGARLDAVRTLPAASL